MSSSPALLRASAPAWSSATAGWATPSSPTRGRWLRATIVNNAGIFIAKPFTEYTDADYDGITGVNLRGFFEVSRAAVSAMLSIGNGGHLVNISTSLVDHADSAVPSALASLTKGGLNAVTKELAIEYAKHHVDGGQSAGR